MRRYLPIVRYSMELAYGQRTSGPRLAVLLDEAIEVRCHYSDKLFPCRGRLCRLAREGKCEEDGRINWYAPALLCENKYSEVLEFTSEAMRAAYAEYERRRPSMTTAQSVEAWSKIKDGVTTCKVDVVTPLLPLVHCIAEIPDKFIDEFPRPLAGVVYRMDKVKGNRLHFNARRPREPVKGLCEPFSVAPFLERIFGMPLFPPADDVADGEEPSVIKFPARKQA